MEIPTLVLGKSLKSHENLFIRECRNLASFFLYLRKYPSYIGKNYLLLNDHL